MHSPFKALFLVSVLATEVALAAPTSAKHQVIPAEPQLAKRTFTVPRIRNVGHIRTPAQAMGRAYRKYGWQMTSPDGAPLVLGSVGDAVGAVAKVSGDLLGSLGGLVNHVGVAFPSSGSSSGSPSGSVGGGLGLGVGSGLFDGSSGKDNAGGASGGASGAASGAAALSGNSYATEVSNVPSNTEVNTTIEASNNILSTSDKAASLNAQSPAAPASANVDTEVGEVIATPAANGAEYLSPVVIGGQTLNLNFDTGSADLWVFSTALRPSVIGQHSAYNSTKSSTFEKLDGATFSLSYGDGSGAAGTVGFDTVSIGDATVTRQAIELATAVSISFVEDADSDGLVGLGFSSINSVLPNPQRTFFENIMTELTQSVFTADLELDGSGTYEFGTIDNAKYKGEVTFTPVNASSGFWQFESMSYRINGKTVHRSNASPAIADTGTSLALLDPEVVNAYYAQVPTAVFDTAIGGYVYDCSANLPDIAIAVGDTYMANIPGSGMTFTEVNSTTCFGGVQSNSGSSLQILGDVLLKHHFTVFHGEDEMLGMAEKA